MATIPQIKGALLEEAILFLLDDSGYSTVENVNNIHLIDIYLKSYRGALWVRGRGESHQIDAIADYSFTPPFSNPLRLLCEAKYRVHSKIGIEVIRNAVGVKKDVEEYFRPSAVGNSPYRHHYQYAVFTTTEFTDEAQNYAYAHDIYLLEMGKTQITSQLLMFIDFYTDQLVSSITRQRQRISWKTDFDINLADLRKHFRESL